MKIYRFDIRTATMITQHNSEEAAISPLLQLQDNASVVCIYLGAGGKLGMHEAAQNQLFLIVSGRGWVRTEDSEYLRLLPGYAAFWKAGEMHETLTHNGLTAIVIEGENINPDDYLQEADLDEMNMWGQ